MSVPDSIENKILELLAREWESNGPPGIMEVGDIVSIIPSAPSDTMETIRELFASGFIDMNTFKTSAFLTPEGYEHINEHWGK
ncbi:MAG: hypothetical protein MI892_05045 [Desulfobacterales bacterium]|nr:hypothetical protein [Desulfobacterales bacterium]